MFENVKEFNSGFFVALFITNLIFSACKKDNVISSGDAVISFSADTLHFDTVLTSVDSVTQKLKIFNLNNQRLHITTISLAGGETSAFKINVNSMPGSSFSDIDIAATTDIRFCFCNDQSNTIQSSFYYSG
jgi:hypothetical protein